MKEWAEKIGVRRVQVPKTKSGSALSALARCFRAMGLEAQVFPLPDPPLAGAVLAAGTEDFPQVIRIVTETLSYAQADTIYPPLCAYLSWAFTASR